MSEFEKVFEENYGFYIDDSCKHRYANSKEFGQAMYEAGKQSQQAKIDELQARVDEALKILESDAIGFTGLIQNYDKAESILKGNKDEN